MSSRFSVYSAHSTGMTPSTAVSTATLLNALHAYYTSGQPYQLDAGTSLVINSWCTAQAGGVIDRELAVKAWEHARRRAEDGCIVLW